MRRRRLHHQLEKREDTHRWLISYADYMTLMFAFFVVLYAMAVVNKGQYPVFLEKLNQAVKHLSAQSQHPVTQDILQFPERKLIDQNNSQAIAGQGSVQSAQSHNEPSVLNNESEVEQVTQTHQGKALDDIYRQLQAVIQANGQKKSIKLDRQKNWLTISLDNQLLFASGSATLLDPAQQVLTTISQVLTKNQNYIRVRGYTDDQKLDSELYRSNWELSVIRATNVLHRLVQLGVAPQRLAVEGFGQYSPLVANTTAENRRENRRVVIAISRFAWQPPEKQKSTLQQSTKLKNKPQESHAQGDSKTILTVPLPGGGVRYTTRQDKQ
ncbi:OmpA family protein [Celerinatantimonas diazotrophica]|uniref:Chemotaxis protein MotB n=1 Tax=Celerinatantimonas diazotrophica TaxID=412034 RepID=A0A4R1JM12_9GAMM|nr:OmpA family protein [Celerinatantimonas diazotrophica]TCK52112.1 chemotaxis protein MotB [Celerinatantimonas diazotrophica]CAG9296183.1 Peptidoglycan-associated lipoprotein [Celerinatantimonas diazotrophica]